MQNRQAVHANWNAIAHGTPREMAHDYETAIAYYTQAIEAHPDGVEAYLYLGLAWLLQGDELTAQATWVSVLAEVDPNQAEQLTTDLVALLLAEARQQRQDNQLDQAIRLYQQVLELQPEAADTYVALGNVLAAQGDLLGALLPWQTAAMLQPKWVVPYERQAEVLEKLGRLEEAIACYSQTLSLQLDQAEWYQALGRCYAQQNQWTAAIALLHQSLQRQPQAATWGDLGYAYLQQGNLEEAIAHLQQAVQLQSPLVEAYCQWAQPEPTQAGLQLNANFLQSLQPPTPLCYGHLGQLLVRQGQLELAIAAYHQAVTLQPTTVQFQLALGQLLFQVHQVDAAWAVYQTALKLSPNSADAVLGIARVLATSDRHQEAIAAADQAIALAPTRVEGHALLGDLASSRKEWAQAIAHYQAALELTAQALEPIAIECWCHLAVAFAHKGQEQEAIACCNTILRLNSNLAPAVWQLIHSLHHQTLLRSSDQLAHVTPVDTPAGWYETTKAWIKQSSSNDDDYVSIHPPQAVLLTPPGQLETSLDAAPHFSFRFGREIKIPGTFLATITRGRFWLDPDQSSSAVITKDNHLLSDLSPEFPIFSPGHPDQVPHQHWTFKAEKLAPPKQIDGTVVVLAGLSNNVYFHWLLDCLPRFELLKLSGLELSQIDYFLVGDRLPFQHESLSSLEISNTKILPLEQHLHIQATKLIVPSFPGAIAWFQPWVADFLRTTFLEQAVNLSAAQTNYPTRLYISRQHAVDRRVVNEAEVVGYLEQIGFVSIDPATLSIAAQAQVFAHAEVIVAPHGSGLTNAIFCAASTKLIEIFSPNFVYPCYWYISNLIQLDYFYLLGELPFGDCLHTLLYPNPRIEDIFVNINTLKQVLHTAGVT